VLERHRRKGSGAPVFERAKAYFDWPGYAVRTVQANINALDLTWVPIASNLYLYTTNTTLLYIQPGLILITSDHFESAGFHPYQDKRNRRMTRSLHIPECTEYAMPSPYNSIDRWSYGSILQRHCTSHRLLFRYGIRHVRVYLSPHFSIPRTSRYVSVISRPLASPLYHFFSNAFFETSR
jgi:hypothetical protein